MGYEGRACGDEDENGAERHQQQTAIGTRERELRHILLGVGDRQVIGAGRGEAGLDRDRRVRVGRQDVAGRGGRLNQDVAALGVVRSDGVLVGRPLLLVHEEAGDGDHAVVVRGELGGAVD